MAKRRKLRQPSGPGPGPGRPQQKAKTPARPGGRPKSAGASQQQQQQQQQQHKKKQHQQQQHEEEPTTIPFGPDDRILLIGEGDLSFAASLIEHHGCTNVTATVLEKDHAELLAKYPAVDAHVAVISRRPDPGLLTGSGSGADSDDSAPHPDSVSEPEPDSSSSSSARKKKRKPSTVINNINNINNKLIYGVDAAKLPSSIARVSHDHILFNFPHVGGKSTDVNRQVRYNQQLLVSFFQRALSSPAAPLAPGGTIVVTLFDGEPYTLWNIRDLARHAGLQVERSFRFRAEAYPGYRHARTLGVVRSKKGEEGGGWRGEHRPARSYVFVRKGGAENSASKKRRRHDDDDDSSSDD